MSTVITIDEQRKDIVTQLAEIYPQLYLDPDVDEQSEYQRIVRRGERPERSAVNWFHGHPEDREETVETPVGPVRVITLGDRRDFESFVRNMLAAKKGPRAEIPATMGAATLVVFNWPRIHAHKAAYLKEQAAQGVLFPDWPAEFRRFTAVKSNYQDMLIVLSTGPYSNVGVEQVRELGDRYAEMTEEAWCARSLTIRKYHELTHVICRGLYPARISPVWDELVADATGVLAAFDTFDPALVRLFLGIGEDGRYRGGRLENYLKEEESPDQVAEKAGLVLQRFARLLREHEGDSAIDRMLLQEELQEELNI